MEKELKKALLEAAKWEKQLTEHERTKISFAEARLCVVNRIFEKYKNNTSINQENGNDDNRLLTTVNFCTMSNDKLMKILDFCDVTEVVSKTEMIQKIKGGECIEKRWEWYDTLIVTPKEIKFSTSPYPSHTIMTTEKYLKMKAIFNER